MTMSEMQMQITFGLYLLGMIAIGTYFYLTQGEKMARMSTYLLADRQVSVWPTAFSASASLATGFMFFAWVGIGYAVGIAGIVYPIMVATAVFILWRYIAPRFRRGSEELDSYTMVDHIAVTYGNQTPNFHNSDRRNRYNSKYHQQSLKEVSPNRRIESTHERIQYYDKPTNNNRPAVVDTEREIGCGTDRNHLCTQV